VIGVAAQSGERDIVREFFELFKTPWEFYRPGQRYQVLLCTQEQCPPDAAGLALLYHGGCSAFDEQNRIAAKSCLTGSSISWDGRRIPLYGRAATFPLSRFSAVKEEAGQEPIVFLNTSGQKATLRIGYDLFSEVARLLSVGQPAANAHIPTLELHIGLLRALITRSGMPLVEIPPVPHGYSFVTCLTHDLDHPALRNHRCDHTMFGFLGRATLGSLIETCRGRKRVGDLFRNWVAAGKLPFVYLGMARDIWSEFDRYLELERGLGSTYFVIPRKNYAGRQVNGSGSAKRASRYEVSQIKPQLAKIISAGSEVALHGIDAWLDSASGCDESALLIRELGGTEMGVRMHWLLFGEQSPAALDQAGFSYDSSFGYNNTVGYRAGTAQSFKPIGAAKMLELPLHIMDTALFLPRHLRLCEAEAGDLVNRLIEEVERFGGALTINWHDRSIAPERLWETFYLKLVGELKQRGAWFPTASQAVSWFRKRRSAMFGAVELKDDVLKVSVSASPEPQLPGLRVRVHRPRAGRLDEPERAHSFKGYEDREFQTHLETAVAIAA
jgi:hypothetical protein